RSRCRRWRRTGWSAWNAAAIARRSGRSATGWWRRRRTTVVLQARTLQLRPPDAAHRLAMDDEQARRADQRGTGQNVHVRKGAEYEEAEHQSPHHRGVVERRNPR